MPLQRVGNSYRWGDSGKRYYYKVGDKKSREEAKAKAMRQARAIEARKHKL
jgi:hypothetical protein